MPDGAYADAFDRHLFALLEIRCEKGIGRCTHQMRGGRLAAGEQCDPIEALMLGAFIFMYRFDRAFH